MKAILVIDMPSCCNDCHYCQYIQSDEYLRCVLKYREVKNDMKKPNWCPLKPMPQRKMVGEIEKVDDFMKSDIQIINEKVTAKIMLDTELLLASGYNLCIDEILGEQNDTDI